MSQVTFDTKSDRHGVHIKYMNEQDDSTVSDQILVTPAKGGRNAGIYFSNDFISKIDAARGDVRRSTFVMRAVERKLEEMVGIRVIESYND